MPIHVSWDDANQSITLMDFVDHWTWDEYFAAVALVTQMARSVSHRVDHISDLSRSGGIPSGALRAVARSIGEKPDGPQMIVLAGGGIMVESLIGLFRRLFPRAAKFLWLADSREAARTLIARVRAEAAKKAEVSADSAG